MTDFHEPWRVGGVRQSLIDRNGRYLGAMNSNDDRRLVAIMGRELPDDPDNTRRIVQCVNFCAGTESERLNGTLEEERSYSETVIEQLRERIKSYELNFKLRGDIWDDGDKQDGED